MHVTFPDAAAHAAEVVDARPGADPATGAEAVQIALQAEGEDPQVFSLSICDAYQLRELIDAALEAPFWWEDDLDDDRVVLGLAIRAIDAVLEPEVLDLARPRTVRWDETWSASRPC
jgi:hypothetical protein